jgi:hypothetical protein
MPSDVTLLDGLLGQRKNRVVGGVEELECVSPTSSDGSPG